MKIYPITISEKAIEEIKKTFLQKNIPTNYGLRVGIKAAGCGAMSFSLGFDEKQEDDVEYDFSGVIIYIEKKQMMYLMGKHIDFHENTEARGFMFKDQSKKQVL